MMRWSEHRDTARGLPVTQAILTPGFGRIAVRFTLRK